MKINHQNLTGRKPHLVKFEIWKHNLYHQSVLVAKWKMCILAEIDPLLHGYPLQGGDHASLMQDNLIKAINSQEGAIWQVSQQMKKSSSGCLIKLLWGLFEFWTEILTRGGWYLTNYCDIFLFLSLISTLNTLGWKVSMSFTHWCCIGTLHKFYTRFTWRLDMKQ